MSADRIQEFESASAAAELTRVIDDLLGATSRGPGSPLPELERLAGRYGPGVHRLAVARLFHLDLDDAAAGELLRRIEVSRGTMRDALGRDPGFAVAAADVVTNERGLLSRPTIVEAEFLRRVEQSAVTDALTGLYNRRFFDRTLRGELRRSERYRRDTALLMLDLDRFKEVNDRHGHRFGDRVLRAVGAVVRGAVREADVACRFGGEEFAIVLPETERLGALAVAERIREAVFERFDRRPVDGQKTRVTVSGGIACSPVDAGDPNALIERADRALYHAKAQGRNRINTYYDEKRRSVRYPVRPRTQASVSADPVGTRRVRPVNLSMDGALFATELALDPSQALDFILGAREPTVMPSTVVRVEAGNDDADDRGVTRRVAIRFLRRMSREVLEAHVVRRAPGRPDGARR